jgi:hypothetical protein
MCHLHPLLGNVYSFSNSFPIIVDSLGFLPLSSAEGLDEIHSFMNMR